MRSADHVILSNTKERQSWWAMLVTYRRDITDHVQLDAGMHPAYDGLAALPFYDEFDLSTVDILLISQ